MRDPAVVPPTTDPAMSVVARTAEIDALPRATIKRKPHHTHRIEAKPDRTLGIARREIKYCRLPPFFSLLLTGATQPMFGFVTKYRFHKLIVAWLSCRKFANATFAERKTQALTQQRMQATFIIFIILLTS